MDFSLTTEQQQIQSGVQGFVKQQFGNENANEFSMAAWQEFAEAGWPGLPFSELVGGHNGTLVDTMLVGQVLAAKLAPLPYTSLCLAGFLVEACAKAQPENAQPGIEALKGSIKGEHLIASALYEPTSRFSLDTLETRAVKTEAGYQLTGIKSAVLAGDKANSLVVSAMVKDLQAKENKLGLFLVNTNLAGVELVVSPTIDGQSVAQVKFKDVELESDCRLDADGNSDTLSLIEHAVDKAALLLSAEAVVTMDQVLTLTLDYCRQRKQFNQAISSFQVVQHRLADMYMDIEAARSLLYAAAIKVDEQAGDARQLISAAKHRAGEIGRSIVERAVQLHGAIGFTEEYILNAHYKRLIANNMLYGDAGYHMSRFIDLSQAC